MKPLSPHEYHITVARDGFLIVDGKDSDVEPPRRYTTWVAAMARLKELVAEDIEATRQEQEQP